MVRCGGLVVFTIIPGHLLVRRLVSASSSLSPCPRVSPVVRSAAQWRPIPRLPPSTTTSALPLSLRAVPPSLVAVSSFASREENPMFQTARQSALLRRAEPWQSFARKQPKSGLRTRWDVVLTGLGHECSAFSADSPTVNHPSPFLFTFTE